MSIAPPPYKNIAVASTFSPRFEAVLAEAKRVRDRLGSKLSLIHVGQRSQESTRKFSEALAQLDLPADSTILYGEGDPADVISQLIAKHDIDLVVAGALEKELVLHPFLGNVARRLVREAGCSVFLFTKPDRDPKPLRRIVFLRTHSQHAPYAFAQTLQLARAERCEQLYVIRVVTTFDQARAAIPQADNKRASPSFEDQELALEQFVLGAGVTDVPIEVRCLRGNTGFAAADFVHSVAADLLVVPAVPSPELPNNLAWLTDVIPCNLWLIR
ncbi:MAG TPA: universal stress protein [Chthoniobacterales bacterium]|nr:universal stress protein [Chthoniobacterales bacterium]